MKIYSIFLENQIRVALYSNLKELIKGLKAYTKEEVGEGSYDWDDIDFWSVHIEALTLINPKYIMSADGESYWDIMESQTTSKTLFQGELKDWELYNA